MKIITGKVISKKMAKTATVSVEQVVIHPLYKKRYRRLKKFQVHDDLGTQVGQTVKFCSCKPYSKMKKWRIIEIKKIKVGSKKSNKEQKIGGKT